MVLYKRHSYYYKTDKIIGFICFVISIILFYLLFGQSNLSKEEVFEVKGILEESPHSESRGNKAPTTYYLFNLNSTEHTIALSTNFSDYLKGDEIARIDNLNIGDSITLFCLISQKDSEEWRANTILTKEWKLSIKDTEDRFITNDYVVLVLAILFFLCALNIFISEFQTWKEKNIIRDVRKK